MSDIVINHNFASIRTWEEAGPLLDSVLLQMRDGAAANPSLLSLVDPKGAEPSHKAGDLVTAFDDQGNLQLKVSNGRTLTQINVNALSGPLTPAVHGNIAAGASSDLLHGAATSANNGFMVAADKSKLDTYEGSFNGGASPPALAANGNFAIWRDAGGDAWVVIRTGGTDKLIGPAA